MGGTDHSEVEARFSQIRRKLDAGGYLESVGLDSLRLVEHLFGDLVKTTESLEKTLVEFSRYKKVAEELECGVAPFKDENVRLHRENSQLRIALAKAFEEAEDKARDPSLRLRDIEAENNDLKLLVSQFAERIKRTEAESLEKTKRIIKFQERELGPSVVLKGEQGKRPTSLQHQKPSMEVDCFVADACPQCIRLRNYVEYGKNTEKNPKAVDYMKLADSRIEALQLQLRSFKNLEKEHLTLISSLKTRIDTRESEIQRLRDLIKVRPGRDNKANAGVQRYSDENKDLNMELKSAEMQLKVLQRRNIELEEKLKKSILQEHQDYMLGKVPSFYSESNVTRIFLEKELDKYPSHDKMTLLEKLYYLERQLSHCCKEKAILKNQIDEYKLRHTSNDRPIFKTSTIVKHKGKQEIKDRNGILKTRVSNSRPGERTTAKPAKVTEGARKFVDNSKKSTSPTPDDTTEHEKRTTFDNNNAFLSDSAASENEDISEDEYIDENEDYHLISEDEYSESAEEHPEKMSFAKRDSSRFQGQSLTSSEHKRGKGQQSKIETTKQESAKKQLASKSSILEKRAGKTQSNVGIGKVKPATEVLENNNSAEYSNGDEINGNIYDDNGNVESRKQTHSEINDNAASAPKVPGRDSNFVRRIQPKSAVGQPQMLKNSQAFKPGNVYGRTPEHPTNKRTGTNPHDGRQKPGALISNFSKRVVTSKSPEKIQKGKSKSGGGLVISKTASQNSRRERSQDSLEDVQEEEQERVYELDDDIEFSEPIADSMKQKESLQQTSKRKGTKNISNPQGRLPREAENIQQAEMGGRLNSKTRDDGKMDLRAQAISNDSYSSRFNTDVRRTNFEGVHPSIEDDELNETGYYDDEDDEFDDKISSNNNENIGSHGRRGTSYNSGVGGGRNSELNAVVSKDPKGNSTLSAQQTAKQPGKNLRGANGSHRRNVGDFDTRQFHAENTKVDGEHFTQNMKKNNSAPGHSQTMQKSTGKAQESSVGERSDGSTKKAMEKNKGISAVKEPSLLSISEFERDQSDEDYTNHSRQGVPTEADGYLRDGGIQATSRQDQSNPSGTRQRAADFDSYKNLMEKESHSLNIRGRSKEPSRRNTSGESPATNQGLGKRTSQPLETTNDMSSDQNFADVTRGFVDREFNRGGGDDPVMTFGGSSVASYPRKDDERSTHAGTERNMRKGASVSRYTENVGDDGGNTKLKTTASNPTYGSFHSERPSLRSVGVNTDSRQGSWMDSREDSHQQKSLLDKIATLQRKLDEVHAESSGHQLKSFELQGELERTKHMLQVEKQERDMAVTELKRVRELNNESTARMLMNSALVSDGSFRRGQTPMEMEREIVNLRSALANLDRDKDEMRVELDRKDERMARLTNDASKYMDEICQLKLHLKNAELQINHTGESAKEQTREVEFLKKQVESNRRDLEKTIRERDEALKHLHQLSATNAKGQLERRSVESELELKNKEADDLRRQVQRYIDEVRRIEELLLDKEEEMETLIQHYKSLTLENGNLEAQRTSLEREASSIRESVRDAVDQNISFKTHLASQNALINSLEQEIQTLTQQISQLENQAESKSEKEKMLEADVKASKDLIYRLEVQMDKLKLDMADSESKRKQFEAENSELNAHISSLEARLNDETEKQHQLENLVANSREKDFQLERTTMGISRERDELAEKLTSLQQRSETLNSEVSRYRLKSIELQSELDRTRRQLDNEKRDRETALTELRRVREQLNSSSANYLLNTALGTGSSGSQFGGNITDSSIQHATTPSSGSTFRQNLFATELLQKETSREQSPFATSQGTPFDMNLDPPMATSTTRGEEQPGPSTSISEQSRSKGALQTSQDDEFEEWDSPGK